MQIPLMYRGYHHVHLRHAGERKRFFVHQLVAIAFHPNPESKPYVNHIDRDKTNNRIENLEWVTEKENTAHWMNDDKQKLAYSTACQDDTEITPEDLPF